MKLSEFKLALNDLTEIRFELENGARVPRHFHVTEVGKVSKHFIDCGGVVRQEEVVNFQLWNANDTDHRLAPSKLLNIIQLSEEKLGIEDKEIEVEYQSDTIGKFGLKFQEGIFVLTSKQTDCLAKDNCGIPVEKLKVNMKELTQNSNSCCTPGGGCC